MRQEFLPVIEWAIDNKDITISYTTSQPDVLFVFLPNSVVHVWPDNNEFGVNEAKYAIETITMKLSEENGK